MVEIKEGELKAVLRLTYISAYLTASASDDNKYLEFAEQRFEEYYELNKTSFLLRLNLSVKGAKIYIHPITKHLRKDDEATTGQEFMFEDYGGWEGAIVGPAKNGEYDAYKVKISPDGIYFVTITINVEDVFPLEDKKHAWKQK